MGQNEEKGETAMKNLQAKIQTFAGAMMVPVILLVLVGFFVGIGITFFRKGRCSTDCFP